MADHELARAPLTSARITDVALDLIVRDGLDAFSMRGLGRELGVDPMAVYHHVPSKRALFDALATAVWARVELPADDDGWETRLRALAREVRRVLISHAAVLPIVATRSSLEAGSLRVLDHGMGALQEAGLAPDESLAMLSTATSWLIGQALAEAGPAPAGGGTVADEEVRHAFRGGDAAPTHPHLAAAAAHDLPDWDAVFDVGLDVLVAGVRARAAH